MSTCRVGIVTIGQAGNGCAPTRELHHLAPDLELAEYGALDGCDTSTLTALAPGATDTVLSTRLRTGRTATLALDRLRPRIDAAARAQDGGAELVLLACTGDIPLTAVEEARLLTAHDLLRHTVAALAATSAVDILVPRSDQLDTVREQWRHWLPGPVAARAVGLEATRDDLAETTFDGELLVLDCMSYPHRLRHRLQQATGKPVLLARSVIAHQLAALLA